MLLCWVLGTFVCGYGLDTLDFWGRCSVRVPESEEMAGDPTHVFFGSGDADARPLALSLSTTDR